jgi:hypothetical protein
VLAAQPVEVTKRIAAAAITVTVSFRMGPSFGSGLRAVIGYPQTPAQKSDFTKSFLSNRAIESFRKSEGDQSSRTGGRRSPDQC